MAFKRDEVATLLAQCHRRCCICHRFCGVKIETDHMQPREEGGGDSIENAIPVCFECHAEIHSYNDKHPRGRKFTSVELAQHKDQWLRICRENPGALLDASRQTDVGPIQSMVDELDYNVGVLDTRSRGCGLKTSQFDRAIHEGSISILEDELREALIKAYIQIARANEIFVAEATQNHTERMQGAWSSKAGEIQASALPIAKAAREKLICFLSSTDSAPQESES